MAAALLPAIVQTRPQVGCDPDLPLPVDKGKESLVEDGPDVIVSGWKLDMKISDVSRGICVIPDEFPVIVPKKAVEPLVFTCGRYDEITGWLCTGFDLACG